MGASAEDMLMERHRAHESLAEFPRYMVQKGHGKEFVFLPLGEAKEFVAAHPGAFITTLVLLADWTLGTARAEPGMEPLEFSFPRGAD